MKTNRRVPGRRPDQVRLPVVVVAVEEVAGQSTQLRLRCPTPRMRHRNFTPGRFAR